VVVPGLLACLALRFDASRATDMRARAAAAADALQRAVGALGPGLADDAYMSAGADAAAAAYDGVADSEADARRRMQARRPWAALAEVGLAAGLGGKGTTASPTRRPMRAGAGRRGALGPPWRRQGRRQGRAQGCLPGTAATGSCASVGAARAWPSRAQTHGRQGWGG
jgi:hypothetical protein